MCRNDANVGASTTFIWLYMHFLITVTLCFNLMSPMSMMGPEFPNTMRSEKEYYYVMFNLTLPHGISTACKKMFQFWPSDGLDGVSFKNYLPWGPSMEIRHTSLMVKSLTQSSVIKAKNKIPHIRSGSQGVIMSWTCDPVLALRQRFDSHSRRSFCCNPLR